MKYSINFWKRSTIALSIIFFTVNLSSQVKSDTLKSDTVKIKNLNPGSIYGRTNSMTTIGKDEFIKGNIKDPIQLIQGKVAGFSISKAGGDLNNSPETRLRGLTTIIGKSNPLIIIDGVREASLENLDPNELTMPRCMKNGTLY